MKKTISIFSSVLILLISFNSCKKKEKEPDPTPVLATITTSSVSNITTNSAICGGNISSDGGAGILEKGVVWSTSPNPSYDASGSFKTNDGAGLGQFTSTMNTNISPSTTYYVKAYAKNSVGIAYGNEVTFTSLALSIPVLTTGNTSSITSSSASVSVTITNDGGSTITERGVVWSTNVNPTTADNKTIDGTGIGSFVSYLACTSNTTYYARAYATNSVGTAYGNEIFFTTKLAVGDNHQGGIIAYLLQSGDVGYDANVQHGIIAASTDQSTATPWALTFTATGATSAVLGNGQSNTNTIIANQGAGTYAAALANDLIHGGYSDWYLPSIDELNKLYLNKTAIGGFAIAFYWSSSESDANSAWVHSFNSNSQSIGTKNTNYNIRAIRSF